jgi:hypothetical protein
MCKWSNESGELQANKIMAMHNPERPIDILLTVQVSTARLPSEEGTT